MAREPTVRRRRGQSDDVTSTVTSTTTEVASTSIPPSTTPASAKSIPELLTNEYASLKQFFLFTAVVISFFSYMIFNTALSPQGRVFAVMIDAGSTGTRAQVFTFRKDPDTNRLWLDNTKMFMSEKSLAALATGTSAPGPFFKPLLDKVKKAVPGIKRRKRTPIALRATAGLRLLGANAAERALEQARVALNASEFLFREEWVGILEEKEEAAHAWISLNYLKGGLQSGLETDFVGALELGGGSMQVVYRKGEGENEDEKGDEGENADGDNDGEGVVDTATESDTKVTVLDTEYTLHTTSYLGLGLLDFMKKLYTLFDNEGVLEEGNPCFRKGKLFEGKTLRFGVPGSEEKRVVTMTGDGDFERCVASAEIAIGTFSNLFMKRNHLPKGKSFYAFAYFYDRTVGLGLSSSPTKEELNAKGKDLCETAADSFIGLDRDESCAEFSYIYALLKLFTLDFSEEAANILFEQYIDGHMLGWALGATLETIQPVMHMQLALDKESVLTV